MNTISVTRRTIRREWTIFGILIMLSVGLMGVSGTPVAQSVESTVNVAVSPIETVVNGLADTAGSYWSALTQIDRLRTQIEQYRLENQTLQEELARMPGISQLNEDWTLITQEAASLPYQTAAARVIVRDISEIRPRTVIINKGTKDGLTEGMVVVDSGGAIVGRIQALDATVSTVLLVNDTTAVVVGKEAKTGAIGTVRGQVSGLLEMSYVEASAKLVKGDAVVTAGEALPCTNDRSPYPPGLLIGSIVKVSSDPNAVVQSADIMPAASLSDASFVLVIVNYEGGFGPPVATAVPTESPSPGGSAAKPTIVPTAQPTSAC
jgi:rod shape-determining protein MreC